MQFFKSTMLFALALATYATASALPQTNPSQCIPHGGGCNPNDPQTFCCDNWECFAQSDQSLGGQVSIFDRKFSLWYLRLIRHLVPTARLIRYLSALQTGIILPRKLAHVYFALFTTPVTVLHPNRRFVIWNESWMWELLDENFLNYMLFSISLSGY